jgi:hypothetical protein
MELEAAWDRAREKQKSQERHLKRAYGITLLEYNEMVRETGGKCEICLSPTPKLFVDHNHKTNKVRGLLCKRCNFLVGYLEVHPAIRTAAEAYIKERG